MQTSPVPDEKPTPADAMTEKALKVFQRRTSRALTREDGRDSQRNLTGFFAELLSWKREDDAAARAAGGAR